jgi:hypothetical protein
LFRTQNALQQIIVYRSICVTSLVLANTVEFSIARDCVLLSIGGFHPLLEQKRLDASQNKYQRSMDSGIFWQLSVYGSTVLLLNLGRFFSVS